MKPYQERSTSLPITRELKLITILSLVIAVLMAAASVAGLVRSAAVYPTDELFRAFVPNDVVNIVIGLPILLGSLWLSHRGKLLGLLFWPGALFYMMYNYLVYVFAMPPNLAFLLHLTLVTASVYSLIGLIAGIDGQAVQQRLAGVVPERLSGGVLAGLGLLFLLRVVGALVTASVNRVPISEAELALYVTDFIVSPAWIVGGLLLWQRKAFGYVAGLGLLFQACMLFIGLIVVFLLQPWLIGAPFPLVDVVVVFVMGLVCFVPFGLFVRGVVSKGSATSHS